MSIQHQDYTSKKTGKTTRKYFANVWYAAEGRSITGPMRTSEKLARQDETDIQREIEAGRPKPLAQKRAIKIDAVFDLWHEATAPPVYANSTWQVYDRFYRDYIKPVFGDKSVAAITPVHVQRYINLMKGKYEAETVNKCINILTNLFGFAITPLKCITINPASDIKRCSVPRKKKITWNDDMISYFLQLPNVRQSHYYPMLCLSAMLGARPGEVCGLTESSLLSKPYYCIDFSRGYDNWKCETDLKNKQSHRTPPIPKYLYDIIHKQLIWKKKMRLENSNWGQNDFLFVRPDGEPVTPDGYGKAFKRLLSAHKQTVDKYLEDHGQLPFNMQELPHIGLYGFRTSFATNNMRRCPNPSLISSIMGNSPKTLMEFYAQPEIDMQQDLINQYADGIERTIS